MVYYPLETVIVGFMMGTPDIRQREEIRDKVTINMVTIKWQLIKKLTAFAY